MEKGLRFAISAVIIIVIVFSMSCKKAEVEAPPEREAIMEQSKEEPSPSGALPPTATKRQEAEADEDSRGLEGHFVAPVEVGKERLLEYKADMTYETEDIRKSRSEIIAVVAKYGFIKQSYASTEETKPVMSTDLLVRSDRLYQAILELDRAGILLTEQITVTDHTDSMVLQDRKARREQIRITRKNLAATQVTGVAKNWNEIENSLSRSEDSLDLAEHEKWRIRDKVAWAWIHVNLKGPDQPSRVIVPRYTDALVGLVNLFLRLIYVLIYTAPFLAIIAVIAWKRDRIVGIFRREKKE